MYNPNIELQELLALKRNKLQEKKKRAMKVSGAGVKKLGKLIREKAERVS
ncbi:hypothetical protein GW935_01660 [Candidatus Falkowbacteria bacterium]|nr:hypothetical protein [Candidatus Falkowbacteria bacterium]